MVNLTKFGREAVSKAYYLVYFLHLQFQRRGWRGGS